MELYAVDLPYFRLIEGEYTVLINCSFSSVSYRSMLLAHVEADA